jgi:hypothetical protein
MGASGAITVCSSSRGAGGDSHGVERSVDFDAVPVRSERQIRTMVEEILDPQRDYPIVCLTARADERRPAQDAAEIRRIVGPGIPVYFAVGSSTIQRVRLSLPKGLGVWGGATRVWLPGVNEASDPREHLLILDLDGAHESAPLRKFARRFRRDELPVERRVVLTERQRSAAQIRANRLERCLRRTVRERDVTVGRESLSEDHLRLGSHMLRHHAQRSATKPDRRSREGQDLKGGPEDPTDDQADLEGELYTLICAAWVAAVPSADRTKHPLRAHLLDRQLVEALSEQRIGLSLAWVGYVCAMVACGLPPHLTGIEPQPLREKAARQIVRTDGATGWCCNLQDRDSPDGPRLHYWIRPDGQIHFSGVTGYGDRSAA